MIAVPTAKVSKSIKGAYTDGLRIAKILPVMGSVKIFLGTLLCKTYSSFDGAAIRWFQTKCQA